MAAKIKPSKCKNEREEDNTQSDSGQTQKDKAIEGIMQAIRNAGLTFDDVLEYHKRHNSKQGSHHMQKSFRKKTLSSGLEMMVRQLNENEGAFSERYSEHTRDLGAYVHTSMRDGKPVLRYRPAEGLYMVVKPVVDEVKIHDGPVPIDMLFKYALYFKFYLFSFGMVIFSFFSLLLSPVVWMDVTGTDANFFNQTNGTSGPSSGLKSFSWASFMIFLVCAGILFTNWLLMLNPSMRRLQWDTMKWRIMATLGLNSAYTIASASMFPHVMHLVYLYFRTVGLIWCVYYDSFVAFLKLRMTPEKFVEQVGGSGKKGWVTTLASFVTGCVILQDMFRHYLIMFVTDNASIVSFNVRNPLNGNTFEITNKHLVDATYFTCMLFFAQSMHAFFNTSQLKTTCNTKFFITNK